MCNVLDIKFEKIKKNCLYKFLSLVTNLENRIETSLNGCIISFMREKIINRLKLSSIRNKIFKINYG